ncbi:MAG: GNAT family N-acetyltransferase [Anaerolineae bacterium]
MSTLVSQLGNLSIYELARDDMQRVEALTVMFQDLMPQYAFYVERILRSIGYHDTRTGDRHHVWLAELGSEPVGLAVTEYLAAYDLGLGMDIAVYPQYRELQIEGQRIAQAMIKARIRQLEIDGYACGRTGMVPLAVEVDSPQMVRRFKEYGMMVLPVRYYEPPDVSGATNPRGWQSEADTEELEALGYHQMHLGLYPPDTDGFQWDDPALWERVLRAFYLDHYHLTEDNRALLIARASFQR